MPQYAYSARNSSGELVNGRIAAASFNEAIEHVRGLGHFPIDISRESGVAAPAQKRRNAPREDDLLVFTRQLARLLESGVALSRALELLSSNSPTPASRGAAADLLAAVRGGAPLHEAVASLPEFFPELYSGMVRAGEAGGALPLALKRLADHYEKRRAAASRIMAALTYPAIILSMGVVTVIFLIAFVIPRFREVFDDLGQTLPPPTRILVALGGFAASKWWLLIALPVLAAAAFRAALASEGSRLALHRLLLAAPGAGALARMSSTARFCRVLGTLLQNGVPILQAMDLASANAGNLEIIRRLEPVRAATEEGVPVNVSFQRCGLFDPLTIDITAVAEETGTLPAALLEIAAHLDDAVLSSLQKLMSVIEPAIIIAIGALIAFIVSAILLPILQLNMSSL